MKKKYLAKMLTLVACSAVVLSPFAVPTMAAENLPAVASKTVKESVSFSAIDSIRMRKTPVLFQTTIPDDATVIHSQDEWNNFVATYDGMQDVYVALDCDISATSDTVITLNGTDVNFTLDLNGYTFTSDGNTFTVTSDTEDTVSCLVQNGVFNNTQVCIKSRNGLNASGNPALRNINATLKDLQVVNISGTGISAVNISYDGSIVIDNCTVSGVADNYKTQNTYGIDVSYSYNITINGCNISDFATGVYADYTNKTSYPCILSNTTITKFQCGVSVQYASYGLVISGCTISGTSEPGTKGVVGFGMPGSVSEAITNDDCYNIKDSLVENVYDAFSSFTSMYVVKNCKVQNVNSACKTNGSAQYVVLDSELIAAETVDANSYGVCCESTGFHLVNTKITGFTIGAHNDSATSTMVGCELDNLELNADVSCFAAYACVFRNAKTGLRTPYATAYLYDCSVIGPEGELVPDTIGIYSSCSDFKMFDIGTETYPVETTLRAVSYGSMIDSYNHYKEKTGFTPDDAPVSLITNYDTGLYSPVDYGSLLFDGCDVFRCNTGVNTESLYTQGQGLEVYDAKVGVTVKSTYLHGPIKIHDCSEVGYICRNWLTTSGNFSIVNIEAYNCGVGVQISGNVSPGYFIVHDNTGDGLQICRDDTRMVFCGQFYNNQGWNINFQEHQRVNLQLLSHEQMAPAIDRFCFTDGSSGNINMKGAGISSFFISSGTKMSSDISKYLVDESPLEISLSSGDATWLDGVMVFDVPEEKYTEGTPVSYTFERLFTDDGPHGLFLATHVFAEKEGWVVIGDEYNGVGGSRPAYTYQLVLAEGCNVTYDYFTNGGTAISVDYTKRSYTKDSEIDLTPTASRLGYEFVGWNTDPNAHVGLTNLRAGTSNVTLYAIYRKTDTATYHTYDSSLDYTQDLYRFNRETEYYSDLDGSIPAKTLRYSREVSDSKYRYVGYSFNKNESQSADLFTEKTLSGNDALDIYCVYELTGKLNYHGFKGKIIATAENNVYTTVNGLNSVSYTFETVPSYTADNGYKFLGWSLNPDELSENALMPGDVFSTSDAVTDVYAVQTPIPTEEEPAPTTEELLTPLTGDSMPIALLGVGATISILGFVFACRKRNIADDICDEDK